MKNDDLGRGNDGLLSDEQKLKFERLTKEVKSLQKEINNMVREFEKSNNVRCWVSSENPNQIVLEISTDIKNL